MNAVQNFEIRPANLTEAMKFSEMIASSSFCPSAMKNKPGDVILAMQMGAEVGLSPMQAIQNIAVINGRPALWGDAALAVAMGSPFYISHREWLEGTIEDGTLTAYCGITRKNNDEHIKPFSIADAKKANLWGKAGPWSAYPERMLQMRARAFAIRDKFADVLRGINVAEEVQDYEVKKEYRSNVRALPSRNDNKAVHAYLENRHQEPIKDVKEDVVEVEEPQDLELAFQTYMDALEMADDEKQLKAVFTDIKKVNFKPRPDLLKRLIDAKDAFKNELSAAAIIQPEEIERDNINCAGSAAESEEI